MKKIYLAITLLAVVALAGCSTTGRSFDGHDSFARFDDSSSGSSSNSGGSSAAPAGGSSGSGSVNWKAHNAAMDQIGNSPAMQRPTPPSTAPSWKSNDYNDISHPGFHGGFGNPCGAFGQCN